jgi:hypothetical protein
LVLDLSFVNGAPPAGFKSLGDRTFLLAAGDECDCIEQSCFVQAQSAFASKNHQCQRQANKAKGEAGANQRSRPR